MMLETTMEFELFGEVDVQIDYDWIDHREEIDITAMRVKLPVILGGEGKKVLFEIDIEECDVTTEMEEWCYDHRERTNMDVYHEANSYEED